VNRLAPTAVSRRPCVSGKHEIYCCGSRVRISQSGVEVLTEPCVEYCPLHDALYGTKHIDREAVRKSVESKVSTVGFCCRERSFRSEPVVAYGASEMMQVWLRKGLIDCAVVVCEGTGTVITSNGELVQSIGARLTGIVKTSPVEEIIQRIKASDGVVLDEATARIDQLEGVKRAFDLGFRRVAASVASFQSKTISDIRKLRTRPDQDVLVFSVCNTCARRQDLKHIANADIVCASASNLLRTVIGKKSLMQVGVTIPVYAVTKKGKKHILVYLEELKAKLVAFRTSALPYEVEGKGPRLRVSYATKSLKRQRRAKSPP